MGKHTQTAQPIQFWKWLQILSHTEPLNIFFWLLTYFFVISVFSFETSVDWKKRTISSQNILWSNFRMIKTIRKEQTPTNKLQSECTVTVKRIIWTCAYEFAPELNGFHGLYLLCTRLIGIDSICIMYHVNSKQNLKPKIIKHFELWAKRNKRFL